ncbi:MAG: hypothetical protein IPL86_19265 [Flavobacteriales bacterium]|nr:hypothetical protein [Flavobacteriales bacterium]
MSSLASWSISAWIKPTSTTGYRAIFGTPATGPAALYINAGKAGVYTTVDRFAQSRHDKRLNHIVVTGGSTIRIYVNKVADSTYASTAAFGGTGNGRLAQTLPLGASERVAGRLDDIRLFNQVLDTTDIASLSASGNGRGVRTTTQTAVFSGLPTD